MRDLAFFVLAAFLAIGPSAFAQPGIDIATLVGLESFADATVAPDGSYAVVLRSFPDLEEDEIATDLVIIEPGSEERRRIVGPERKPSSPRISPDGRFLAFLAPVPAESGDDDEEFPQVHLLPMQGGESYMAATFPQGVDDFRWASSDRLLVSAREDLSPQERARKDAKDRSILIEDRGEFRDAAVRLFLVTPALPGEDAVVRRLDSHHEHVVAFEASPDGRRAVAVRMVSPSFEALERPPPRVVLLSLDPETPGEREILGDWTGRPDTFLWASDSRSFLCARPVATVDGELSAPLFELWRFEVEGSTLSRLPMEAPSGIDPRSLVRGGDSSYCLVRKGVTNTLVRIDAEGRGEPVGFRALAYDLSPFELYAGGSALVVASGIATAPDRWWFLRRKEDGTWSAERTAGPNPELDAGVQAEVIRYPGANGAEIEAVLHRPFALDFPGPRPLIVMPHGGPFGATLDRFGDDWAEAPKLYAQEGCLVLQPNYHGSEGYGLAFGESIRGRYFELELQDLLAGVRHLVDKKEADPGRLGLIGWSNGAILSIACLTLARDYAPGYEYGFKVCVPGAGDVNWTSDYGVCSFGPAFDDFYLGGPPWKLSDVYFRKSALFRVESVTTPTLIFAGDKDRAVPTSQTWEWFRALQVAGKAPVRMVHFPDEEHSLLRPSSRRRKLEEEFAFVRRHLLGVVPQESGVAQDSRLADLIGRNGFARDGALLGIREEGRLLPELVDAGKVRIGRFEVTRAQWASVFPDYVVPEGTGNHPVTGIQAAEAERYVAALREATRRPYRLPLRHEVEDLGHGEDENTLGSWAGEALSRDRVASVRALAAEAWTTEGVPPLLLAVGSRPALVLETRTGPARIFDLGGNASEWTREEEDGPVVPGGGCAFDEQDPWDHRPPPPAYIGLRVALSP